ncbi:hypothetical protein KUTeg_006627 [Tegillarca granosa]|uniref:E3 ubiquitin-protein ligase SHPRH n=1 Tax=Tegillarca granosa TaxID=220873 RepID=A0ABQ9FDB3_TEGGR|nr:hypothetical protein KUTeg_006627 [Tegillarca granosa]
MSKRKAKPPQHISEEKRKCLSWNMLEGSAETGSLSILSDNDPELLKELQDSITVNKNKQNNEKESCKNANVLNSDIYELFESYLPECVLYVTISDQLTLKKSEFYFEFGRFQVKFTGEPSVCDLPDHLPQVPEFWLYVTKSPGNGLLYIENIGGNDENNPEKNQENKIVFWCVSLDLPIQVLEALEQPKMFQVVKGSYNIHTHVVELIIYGTQNLLSTQQIPSEHIRPKNHYKGVQAIMEHFYAYKGLSFTKKHDIERLYKSVKEHYQTPMASDTTIQHENLKPVLRPYQKRAVAWMLDKENFRKNGSKSISETSGSKDVLHCLYQKIKTPDGTTLYYNKWNGCCCNSLTLKRFLPQENPPGGILADEMGLGKTVEVLACVLNHPREDIHLPEKLPLLSELEFLILYKSLRIYVLDVEMIKDHDYTSKQDPAAKCLMNGEFDTLSTSEYMNCDKETVTDKLKDGLSEIDVFSSSDTVIENGTDYSKENKMAATDVKSADCCEEIEQINKESLKSSDTSNLSVDSLELDQEESQICAETNQSAFQDSVEMDQPSSQNCVEINQSDSQISLLNSCNDFEDNEENVNEEKLESSIIENHEIIDNNTKKTSRKRSKRKKWTNKKPLHRQRLKSEKSETDKQVTPKPKTKNPSRFVELVDESNFTPKNMFDVRDDVKPKEFFECICGQTEDSPRRRKKSRHNVQCVKCGLYQHAECVNYDLNDPYRGEFKCPHCHVSSIMAIKISPLWTLVLAYASNVKDLITVFFMDKSQQLLELIYPPVVSGATLIISPSSICHQWVDEILKHIKKESLKVFYPVLLKDYNNHNFMFYSNVQVYTGVNKQGFIQPMTLAQQDIVLTTYETLRKEIDYVDLPHSNSEGGRKFRYAKRFMAIPSPIVAVEWWRICLDEAQMVECTTTKTAAMALRLTAVNRWCVTGTPIQKSIEDLYGLLLFLGVDPYWVQYWWHRLLYEPLCYGIFHPMYDAVTNVLWRTSKKDVIDQINLPDQTEHLHWLTFSPVEDHFYRRQYFNSVNDAMKRLSKWTDGSTKLSSLDKHTMSQLLYPLLRLRQACCHPQAVRGEFIPIQKTTMTMEELLESLTKKARVECEEAHRQLVGALNGLAAINIIKEQYSEAVENYRDVLRSVEEHKNELRTDELQQLHAMYNLQEILNLKPKGIHPTLRDSELAKQVTFLNLVSKTGNILESCTHADYMTGILCNELKDKYMSKSAAKVASAQEQLLPVQKNIRDLEQEFSGVSDWWLEALQKITERGIDESIIEHVKDELAKECSHPIVPFAMQINCLQNMNPSYSLLKKSVMPSEDGDVAQIGTKRQGTWADSELEISLKAILGFCKLHRVGKDLVQNGGIHIRMLETLKKEFRLLRNVWMYLREEVSAVDELDMAKTRLRVRLPEEPIPEEKQRNILEPSEVDHHKMSLISDKTVGKNELRKKLGQLLYLKNLAKCLLDFSLKELQTQGENDDKTLSQECPICQREMGAEWSVLHCGHCYCLDCIRVMVEQYSFGGHNPVVKCAVCRQRTHRSDISFVSTKKSVDPDNGDDIRVKGSHSTKVEGIVRCLLKIKRDDPKAKALVFSSWTDVLNVISKALEDNDITYRALYAGGKFQRHLSAFKEESDITVLLLPIHSGANGLNLIEATYVLMVEPVLNPAQELQAIGRVHRIGQTRDYLSSYS